MLVGLSGYARCGKDTAAFFLIEERGFVRRSFADVMRSALLVLDPWVDTEGAFQRLSEVVAQYGWEDAKSFPEVRRLIQVYGTEAGRQVHGDDCWVDAVFRSLPEGNVVITDVRFPNEGDRIKAHGGQVWRIRRPGYGPVTSHTSELSMETYPFDLFMVNDASPEVFRKTVLEAVDR